MCLFQCLPALTAKPRVFVFRTKMLRILFYAVVFILFQLIGTGFSLQCYNCIGQQGISHDCEVNLDMVNIQNCNTNFSCALYIYQVEDVVTIKRFCSPPNECDVVTAGHSHTLNVKINSCTTCNSTDLCNSANSRIRNPFRGFISSIVLSVMVASLLSNNYLSNLMY